MLLQIYLSHVFIYNTCIIIHNETKQNKTQKNQQNHENL